jgi:hypothetical protein
MSLVLPVKLIAECPRTDCNGLGDKKKVVKKEIKEYNSSSWT